MLSTNEVLKTLNNYTKQKKYTYEEANKIKLILYQFGEIAYLEFKQIENNEKEKSNNIHKGINR